MLSFLSTCFWDSFTDSAVKCIGINMKNKLQTKLYQMQDSFFITVIKHGLSMMIPFILVGGLSNALLYLPIPVYQRFISNAHFQWVSSLLGIINTGTFGLFSLAMVITLSFSYAMERNETLENAVMYVIVSLGAFGAHMNIGSESFELGNMGAKSCFSAIFVTFLTCIAFSRMRQVKWLSFREYTVGMEGICANAIQAFIPALLIILTAAAFNQILIEVTGMYSVQELISKMFIEFFNHIDTGNSFPAGLLYTVILHILWFLGFHGSNILEPVALTKFEFIGNGQVFSKAFFDVFVVMGGCGTTISVLLVLLSFYRKHRLGKLAKVASFTVAFNINEMLNFGIPIILNPVMCIPFILTPIMSFCISYAAVSVGLVPAMVKEITWTTPVLFSGYVATGSIRGTILQLVCIISGVLIYLPFIRIHKNMEERYAKEQLKVLIKELKKSEEKCENPNLLTRTDKIGLICKVLLNDLQNSIEKDEIYLLFQPQINDDGKCIGAEALLRWEHPDYGFIYPPLIIYLAKEGNLLPELERKIFDMAGRAIRETSDAYDGDFKISVNITSKSLLWDIEKCIQECIDKYDISRDRLWIEITEQDMISNVEYIIDKLNRLKGLGHTLLIDDFGMGHTSLLYLQSNYFDVVKLDGSMVRNLPSSKTNQQIVASIIELGMRLDIKVIAEYVENEEQRRLLSELGCKWYQGYLFSKPVPLREFIEDLKRRNLS